MSWPTSPPWPYCRRWPHFSADSHVHRCLSPSLFHLVIAFCVSVRLRATKWLFFSDICALLASTSLIRAGYNCCGAVAAAPYLQSHFCGRTAECEVPERATCLIFTGMRGPGWCFLTRPAMYSRSRLSCRYRSLSFLISCNADCRSASSCRVPSPDLVLCPCAAARASRFRAASFALAYLCFSGFYASF